jgi:hypothetical protein
MTRPRELSDGVLEKDLRGGWSSCRGSAVFYTAAAAKLRGADTTTEITIINQVNVHIEPCGYDRPLSCTTSKTNSASPYPELYSISKQLFLAFCLGQ